MTDMMIAVLVVSTIGWIVGWLMAKRYILNLVKGKVGRLIASANKSIAAVLGEFSREVDKSSMLIAAIGQYKEDETEENKQLLFDLVERSDENSEQKDKS